MADEPQLALEQVFQKIEPLTRFSRASLILESQNVRVTTGQAFWTFRIHMSNDKESGTDRLPYHASALESEDKLDEVAQQTVRAAYDDFPNRIKAWLSANARNDEELDSADCFNGPKYFGYEQSCSNCVGSGWIPCTNSECRGGKVTCSRCDGHGQYDCPKCKSLIIGSIFGSSGKVRCRACGGAGKRSGNTCPSCNGGGKVRCPKCGGAKKLTCEKCAGQGTLVCSTCAGAGRIRCHVCDATGYLHSIRTVTCTVKPNWNVHHEDARSEVVSELSRRNLYDLRSLATVTQLPPETGTSHVERQYDFECIITEVVLNVADEAVTLVGYGNKAHIFDFKGIVATLLNEDLNSLQQAVSNTGIRWWGNPEALLTATKQFLESEVNIDINNPAFLRDRIIDEDYVLQVKTWLPKGLLRLFAPQTAWHFW